MQVPRPPFLVRHHRRCFMPSLLSDCQEGVLSRPGCMRPVLIHRPPLLDRVSCWAPHSRHTRCYRASSPRVPMTTCLTRLRSLLKITFSKTCLAIPAPTTRRSHLLILSFLPSADPLKQTPAVAYSLPSPSGSSGLHRFYDFSRRQVNCSDSHTLNTVHGDFLTPSSLSCFFLDTCPFCSLIEIKICCLNVFIIL